MTSIPTPATVYPASSQAGLAAIRAVRMPDETYAAGGGITGSTSSPNGPAKGETFTARVRLTDEREPLRAIADVRSWRVDDGVLTVHTEVPGGFIKHITVAPDAWDYVERMDAAGVVTEVEEASR